MSNELRRAFPNQRILAGNVQRQIMNNPQGILRQAQNIRRQLPNFPEDANNIARAAGRKRNIKLVAAIAITLGFVSIAFPQHLTYLYNWLTGIRGGPPPPPRS